MSIVDTLKEVRKTNVTKTVHQAPYDAISPTRAELNQAGKNILITGGGTGVGLATAKAFVQASASTVIILGRRTDVLDTARKTLEDEARLSKTTTKIIAQTCDISNFADVDALWQFFHDRELAIDVFVANAAVFQEAEPMISLGTERIWNMFETNTKASMYLAEKFVKLPGDGQKFIVNVTTGNIHGTKHPLVATFPAYTLTKLAGTLYFQYLAQELPHDKVQVLSYHPGLIFNSYWEQTGLDKELFDDDRLAGQFALWSATKEAAFLHGRTVWSAWDVEELAKGDIRKRIDDEFYFLRGTIAGLDLGMLA
ncbi:NAD(P)-binding protein [Phaeosphaeriaceae sp. SRC1lsM3a]|nr:NAD(P)-binding protein [Stagonospora sp. SRC1lsM3a]